MYQKWYCSNFVIVLSFLLLDILIMSCEAACEDLHNTVECKGWASNGECRLNPAFMIPNCRKSCKKCQGEDTDSAKRRNLHVGLMKTLFVNISDTMIFKVDFKEIDGLWDTMDDFTYFEFSFVLPPDRKTILNISNDGSEFIDAMYVDRTKIMPKAEGVMEIALHDVTKSDGGNYTVAIYVPRKILIMVFMVYVLGSQKLTLDLEPSTSLYHLHAGEEAPIVTCKTDCYPACDVTWHKVGVNSSSVYNLENVLNLGTFETRKIGEYICVAKRRGTGDIGVRGVTFKMKDKTDALKPECTTDSSQVTVVGGVLGALLFLSVIAIVLLMVRVRRLERLRRKKDKQAVSSAANGTTLLLTNTNDNGRTYEQLDENARNQQIYEDVKTGAENVITDASNQSSIYEN